MSMNNGFTMIETLFVLVIICILSSLTMTLHTPHKTEEMILEEMTSFFQQAKMYAMTSKETVTVSVNHNQIMYTSDSTYEVYQLYEKSYFEEYQFTYNAFGNIKTAKTLNYYLNHQHYYFVFQLGSGCFYVKE